MSETLADFLNTQDADAATLQHAVRFLTSELSEDLPQEAQRAELERAADDGAAVDAALTTLEQDGDVLLAADLAVLSALWDDPDERERVRGAIVGAKQKLPIVETVVITTAAMYGLYLLVTRGVSSRTVRRTVRKPDGSFEETEEETKIHDPTGPLKAIGGILGKLVP